MRFGSYRFRQRRGRTPTSRRAGPKRGHGSVQPRFAMEIQLDKAAVALKIDPIELRRRNDIGPGNTQTDQRVSGRVSNGFLECLDAGRGGVEVEGAAGLAAVRARARGRGVSTYISGTNYPIYPNEMPQAAVQVCLDRSGRARIFSGANDIGQGSNTMLAVIVGAGAGAASSRTCPRAVGGHGSVPGRPRGVLARGSR